MNDEVGGGLSSFLLLLFLRRVLLLLFYGWMGVDGMGWDGKFRDPKYSEWNEMK